MLLSQMPTWPSSIQTWFMAKDLTFYIIWHNVLKQAEFTNKLEVLIAINLNQYLMKMLPKQSRQHFHISMKPRATTTSSVVQIKPLWMIFYILWRHQLEEVQVTLSYHNHCWDSIFLITLKSSSLVLLMTRISEDLLKTLKHLSQISLKEELTSSINSDSNILRALRKLTKTLDTAKKS